MALIGFRGRVRMMFAFVILDILINSLSPTLSSQNVILALVMLGLHAACIFSVIIVEYVLISGSIYVRAGAWIKVFKIIRLFALALFLHIVFLAAQSSFRIIYLFQGREQETLWHDPYYWFVYTAQSIVAALYYFITIRHAVSLAHESVYYPRIRAAEK